MISTNWFGTSRQARPPYSSVPPCLRKGISPCALLPLENKGSLPTVRDWLYQNNDWAKTHPIFSGLPTGLLDYQFYREILGEQFFSGQDPPAEVVAGMINTSFGYHSGLTVCTYKIGAGRLLLNSLLVRENLVVGVVTPRGRATAAQYVELRSKQQNRLGCAVSKRDACSMGTCVLDEQAETLALLGLGFWMSKRDACSTEVNDAERDVDTCEWTEPAGLSRWCVDGSCGGIAADDRRGRGHARRRQWTRSSGSGRPRADITPNTPAALTGFQTVRITSTIQSPLTANVLAIESRCGDRVIDQAILVSCDLCIFRPGILAEFRELVAKRLPGFDVRKLILAATHTHSAPVLKQTQYDESSYGDATQPKDYLPVLFQRMADAVALAWERRTVGAVAWGLGHAVVGLNRRLVYADGHAEMLGNTNDPSFRHVEGYEDHSVDILCFYDQQQRLKATAISVACPAQMSQGETVVSADFWHTARQMLRERYGQDLCVLGFCAPAGDQCPHLSIRGKSEARMDQLRGVSRTQELGRRVAESFFDVADVIAKDIRATAPLAHLVQQIDLPTRKITAPEYAIARQVCEEIDAKPERAGWDTWVRKLYGDVCDRYQAQQTGPHVFSMELHVLRLGDVAIATNPFELYVDYGVQIQARSAAEQTFLDPVGCRRPG